MSKDKEYYDMINKIAELKNEIYEVEEKMVNGSDLEEKEYLKSYLQNGYGLVADCYYMLHDMGFSKTEIDIDLAYT